MPECNFKMKKVIIRDKQHLVGRIKKSIILYGNNADLNHFDTSRVTDMRGLFMNSSFNGSIEQWNVSKVQDMSSMFHNAKKFNQPLGQWNVSNVLDMNSMFRSADSFNQPLDSWDVSGVIFIDEMLTGATSFKQSLLSWKFKRLGMENNFMNGKSFLDCKCEWEREMLKQEFIASSIVGKSVAL